MPFLRQETSSNQMRGLANWLPRSLQGDALSPRLISFGPNWISRSCAASVVRPEDRGSNSESDAVVIVGDREQRMRQSSAGQKL
jgi:hypothetical protein